MKIPDNKKVNTKPFTHRLTHWIPFVKCWEYTEPFYEHDGKGAYGKSFIIKKHNRDGLYAVFTRGSKNETH